MSIAFSGGVGCHVLTGYAPNIGSSDAFLASLYVKFPAFPAPATEWNIFGNFYAPVSTAVIQLTVNSTLSGSVKRPTFLVWGNGGGTFDSVNWGSDLTTDVWYNIVVACGGGTLYLIIDDAIASAGESNSGGRTKNFAGNPFAIGARNLAGTIDTPANVEISEVYFWHGPSAGVYLGQLSSRVRRMGYGQGSVSGSGLQVYMPMDGGLVGTDADSAIVVDLFNSANNGTVHKGSGTATWGNEPLSYPDGAITVTVSSAGGTNVTVTPAVKSVLVNPQSPTLSLGTTLSENAKSIAVSLQSPALSLGSSFSATAKSVVANLISPTVQTGVTVSTNALSLVVNPQNETVVTGFTFIANALSVLVSPQNETVSTGTVFSTNVVSVLVNLQPSTVSIASNVTVSVNALSVLVNPQSVTVSTSNTISTVAKSVVVNLQSPTVQAVQNVAVLTNTLSVLVNVQAPTVTLSTGVTVSVNALSVLINLQAPFVTVTSNATVSASVLSVVIRPQWYLINNSILWFKMNDSASNTSVTDDSPVASNGASQRNTSLISTTGQVNQGFDFNGTTDYLIATPRSFPNSVITACAWVKTLATAPSDNLGLRVYSIPRNNQSATEFGIGMRGSVASVFWNNSGGFQMTLSGTTVINDGKWHFIVGTWDNTTMKLYVDSSIVESSISAEIHGLGSVLSTRVGADHAATPGSFWNGQIDNLMVFDRVISTSELSSLYRSGLGVESLSSVDFSTGTTISASVQSLLVSQPSISVSTSSNVTVSTNALSLVVNCQSPALSLGNNFSTTEKSLIVNLQSPTVSTSTTVQVNVISVVVNLNSPSVSGNGNIIFNASVVGLNVNCQSPVISTGTTFSATAKSVIVNLIAPTIQSGTNVTVSVNVLSVVVSNNTFNLSANCVAQYHMNESSWNGTAGEVIDSSGNSNNGQSSAGATTSKNSKLGVYCGSFDGTDDYISAPSSASLNFGTGSLSVFGWINTDTTATAMRFVNKFNALGNGQGFLFDIHSNAGANLAGNLRFRLGDTTVGGNVQASVAGGITAGTWYFVGVTVQPGSSTGLKFYTNAVQVGVSQDISALTGTITNTELLGIGNLPSLAGAFFKGRTDEVTVFNRILTQNEITDLYNSGTGRESLTGVFVSTGCTISLNALSLNASCQSPVVSTSRVISTNVLSVVVNPQAPSFSASGNLTFNASVLGLNVNVQSPLVLTGTTVSENAKSVLVNLQSPTISVSSSVTVNTSALSLNVNLQSPSFSSAATFNASVLSLLTSINSPSVSGSALIVKQVLGIIASLISPSVSLVSNITISSNVIRVVVNINPAGVNLGGTVIVTPQTLVLTLILNSLGVLTDVTVLRIFRVITENNIQAKVNFDNYMKNDTRIKKYTEENTIILGSEL